MGKQLSEEERLIALRDELREIMREGHGLLKDMRALMKDTVMWAEDHAPLMLAYSLDEMLEPIVEAKGVELANAFGETAKMYGEQCLQFFALLGSTLLQQMGFDNAGDTMESHQRFIERLQSGEIRVTKVDARYGDPLGDLDDATDYAPKVPLEASRLEWKGTNGEG